MVANEVIPLVMTALANFLQIYLLLLIVRILLGWFPNIDWMRQPFSALRQLTDPYLDIFRSFIPPLGGIDFSPILGFVLLNVLISLLGGSSLV
jgi:YggT family protein